MKIDVLEFMSATKDNKMMAELLETKCSNMELIKIGSDISTFMSSEIIDDISKETSGSKPIVYFIPSNTKVTRIIDNHLNFITLYERKDETKIMVNTCYDKDLDGRKHQILSYLNSVIYKEESNKPSMIIQRDIDSRKNKRRRQIEARFSSIPNLSGDFRDDVQAICDYSRTREEFLEFMDMASSVFNMSNRHLTRISRATICFDGESLGDEGSDSNIRVYRAMPSGCIIEEGDWVTTSEEYASAHSDSLDESDVVVDYIDVSSYDIYSINDENEAVYAPIEAWGGVSSLNEVWENYADQNKPLSFKEIKPRTLSEINKASGKEI